MRTFIVSLCIAGVCALFTPVAEAQVPPPICNTVREVNQFLVGVRTGRNLAQQAIASVEEASAEPNICDDTEAILDLRTLIEGIVATIVVIPPSEVAACRLQGHIVGLLSEVDELQETCEDVCIADGDFFGNIAASLYCALSIALDGLGLADLFDRLPTTVCGEQFEAACDAQFFATAVSTADCEEFTEGDFEDVFEVAQNNQCAANPDD